MELVLTYCLGMLLASGLVWLGLLRRQLHPIGFGLERLHRRSRPIRR